MAEAPLTQSPQHRERLAQARGALDPGFRRAAAAAALEALLASPAFHAAPSLAGYLPVRGEFDVEPMLTAACASGKRCFVPVLDGSRMRFGRWHPDAALVDNRYGIPEPASGERVEGLAIALVLVPLLAFDATGRRMGMGGGYYDRAFEALASAHLEGPRPRLVGVAYELQRVAALVANPWDIPLDAVITERGWHDC